MYPVYTTKRNRTYTNIQNRHTKKNTRVKNSVIYGSTLNISSNEYSNNKGLYENAVAIDCEMVGVGKKSVLAHVGIVDFNGIIIYNKYVIPKTGVNSITDYRTKFSGITRNMLSKLDRRYHSYNIVKNEVHSILKNKIIVGHGLANDFKVLEFMPELHMIWDTTDINTYKQDHPKNPDIKQPRKLKALAKEFANNNIQLNTQKGHNPIEDARASMNLYRLSLGYPKIHYTNMSSDIVIV